MADKKCIGYFDKQTNKFIKEQSGDGEFYMDFEAFENKSNEVCYISELSDKEYKFEDFLLIAKGNLKLAQIIFQTVGWQTPETVFNELVNSGEIDENGKFLIWIEGNS